MACAWDARRGRSRYSSRHWTAASAGQEEARMNARMNAGVKTIVSVMTAAAVLSGVPRVVQAQSHNHVIQTPQEAQWGPAPPMLPPGAQIAVLAGDPSK